MYYKAREDEFSGESAKSETLTSSGSVEKAADEAVQVLEEKEAEAAEPSQGAYNPETGEINWDCPVRFPCCHRPPLYYQVTDRYSVLVVWPPALAASSLRPPSLASSTLRLSPRVLTVLSYSR